MSEVNREHAVRYLAKNKDGTFVAVGSDAPMVINEDVKLGRIKRECPEFFRVKFLENAKQMVYRGCIIERGVWVGSQPDRKEKVVTVYLYDTAACVPFSVSGVNLRSMREAKQLIDRILLIGALWYGMPLTAEKPDLKEVN